MNSRWLLVALLAACSQCEETTPAGEEGPAPPEAEVAEAASLREYFPAQAGDRWRYRSGEEKATRAVTSNEDDVLFIVGDDRTAPMRLRVSDEAVSFLDVEGAEVGKLLEAPIELGHHWSYTLGDVQCEARYAAVDDEVEVAGLSLTACIVVHRRCLHPAGKPFPRETREEHSETYCPFVGRVREETRLEPNPLAEGDGRRVDELVFYRVAGAPAPVRPETFGCDAFLLHLSDVQAACGPMYRRTAVRDEDGVCTIEYGGGESTLSFEGRAVAGAPDVEGGEGVQIVEENDARVVVRAEGEACPEERVTRLEPLVRSLLRD